MDKFAMLSDDKSTIIYTDDCDAAWNSPNRFLKKEVVGDYLISTVFIPTPLNSFYYDDVNTHIHFKCYVFPHSEEGTNFCEVWGKRAATYTDIMKYHEEAKQLILDGKIIDSDDNN